MKPDGFTIFCDDIRQEIGNKFSFMGVYAGDLILDAQFPVALPKLCFRIHVVERHDAPLLPLIVSIFFPGDPEDAPGYSAEYERNVEQIPMPPADLASEARRTSVLNIVLSPALIKQPGPIKVRCKIGDDTLKLGRLEIKQLQKAELATVPSEYIVPLE